MSEEQFTGAVEALAIQRLQAVQPAWCAVRRVQDLLPGTGCVVLHAGPPYASAAQIPSPVRHSICMAALFEGWATDVESASRLLDEGRIRTQAAQDHRLLVPLAGVLSPRMAVLEVRDGAGHGGAAIHVALNEGQAHATRLGRIDPLLPAHLRWLNGPFADWLGHRVQEPVLLAPLIARALSAGDDGHSRTVEGSRLLADILLRDTSGAGTEEARAFIDAAPAFALNYWMGAAALWLRAAEGLPGCSWISRAGGNGVTFGIQRTGAAGRWISMPAPVPHGTREAAHSARRAVGALGDSAVVDFLGLGAQALAHAPVVREGVRDALPIDAMERPARLLAPSPVVEGLAGSVIDAARCAHLQRGPLVLLGMIDAAGEAGRIGGGVVDVPPALFAAALDAKP